MNKKVVLIGLAVVVVAIIGIVIFMFMGKDKKSGVGDDNKNSGANSAATGKVDTKGLVSEDIKVGEGNAVKSGDTVSINYVGTLTNGTKFDSSYDRKVPFETKIGVGQVIKGWDAGVIGMKVGGKRKLTIPPELAYGAQGAGKVVPPNATLIFEVELLAIK